jgi:hypothetical protein
MNKKLIFFCEKNDTDDSVVSVMVSNYVGNLLLGWTNDDTFITIRPGVIEVIENNSLPAKASIFFVTITFVLVIVISLVWIVVYFAQKYRYINAKKKLDVSLFLFFFHIFKKIFVSSFQA